MDQMFGRSAGLAPEDEVLKDDSHSVLEDPKPHTVSGMPVTGPWKDDQKVVYIGIDCYWGAEKLLWETPGVLNTSVGSASDVISNPIHRESCTGRASHTKIVEVVYDPEQISSDQLIAKASEVHDPTRSYRQGNDVGTQYRSATYMTTPEQVRRTQEIVDAYAPKLVGADLGAITMEIKPPSEASAGEYYRTRDEYQQYLFKNPSGHCPVHSTGVARGI